MTVPDLVSRTVPSPVGPITLAGADGTLTHLRMQDQTHPPPDQERWHEDPEAFADVVEQIEAYRRQVALYLRAIELATGLSASGHLLFV